MSLNRVSVILIVVAAFAAGFGLRGVFAPVATVHAAADRVFELRTYTTPPGKLDALKSRFRDHTVRIFNKHGMTSIGYWVPADAPVGREHADLCPRASQPRSRDEELGRLQNRSPTG